MDYPIKFSAQFKEQLRSLRKARGLSQEELGILIGVNQRRIADIESNPGAVGFDQIMRLLSALGTELVIRDHTVVPMSKEVSIPRSRKAQPAEFASPLPASARHLLATLSGKVTQPEAYLWREKDARLVAPLSTDQQDELIEHLARQMMVNPGSLASNLQRQPATDAESKNAVVPVPEILQQWATALGVSPIALERAVKLTRDERYAPSGLG
ncbi:helix-turn-helix domain-containing protein, partial [Paucibacter sp. R3-3]